MTFLPYIQAFAIFTKAGKWFEYYPKATSASGALLLLQHSHLLQIKPINYHMEAVATRPTG